MPNLSLQNSYLTLPDVFYKHVKPAECTNPRLVIFNHALAEKLGLTCVDASDIDLAAIFSGQKLNDQMTPIALAYAGHQFGHFTILGDGRAHLLGEQQTPDGKLFDLQLKGSGQTPYSRRGDGKAALGPMLREYLISEAMHALHIPTTRSLAVITTGEKIMRDRPLKGAVLTRVAASHLRVGSFQYAALQNDSAILKALADYTIARHYPDIVVDHREKYAAFLTAVIAKQAHLIASWLHVGFIHGVMNTDNMAISGETIDYGPCAFMDQFSMQRVFSSIDHQGRYAYGNQTPIAKWNLSRFAETLLPLLHGDEDEAVKIAEKALEEFDTLFSQNWLSGMRKKLGLFGDEPDDLSLIQDLLKWMENARADYTITFRDLMTEAAHTDQIYQSQAFQTWYQRWQARLDRQHKPFKSSLCLMREHNPIIIPRNLHVEKALTAAEEGDMQPFHDLLLASQNPFFDDPRFAHYHTPTEGGAGHYQTFCGT